MKAVGYLHAGSAEQLQDIEVDIPSPQNREVLVAIKAISVNPVDCKIRTRVSPEHGQSKILGWDAAGEVVAVGPDVENFKVGDQVWYAGDLTKAGSNAEFHVVDERIISLKPHNLSFAEAAAIPLTAITAWEMLFDRLQVQQHDASNESILIIGAAGGVGSIAIQLLKAKTQLQVIATASRPESQAWVKQLGADIVLDHHQSLVEQIQAQNLPAPRYVFSTTHTDHYLSQIAELIAPQGQLGLIDDPEQLDIRLLKRKSVAIHWEFMFTRSMFQTSDIQAQGHLLQQVTTLVESQKIHSTLKHIMGRINAENMRQAHAAIESEHTQGKIVLADF